MVFNFGWNIIICVAERFLFLLELIRLEMIIPFFNVTLEIERVINETESLTLTKGKDTVLYLLGERDEGMVLFC